MFRGFLFFFTLLVPLVVQSQTKRFYDDNGKVVDSVDSYYYTLIVNDNSSNDVSSVSFYTRTNTIYHNEGPTNGEGFSQNTYYYPNGAIKVEGSKRRGRPVGLFKTYYATGHPQSELVYEEMGADRTDDPPIGIIEVWDSLGKQTVSSGNGYCQCNLEPFLHHPPIESGKVENGVKVGEWKGIQNNTADFTEFYDNGILIKGVQHYKGETYEYTKVSEDAHPENGMKAFYEQVAKRMKYPTKARRKGIEGRVFVEFVIDKDGSLIDGKIVKGIDKECDQQALNAVMSSPEKWKMGYQRGRPVKQRYTLPLIFKLG